MSLEKYLQAPWGLDRRDSAIRKEDGLLYELENLMIDEGSMKTRKGLTRFNATALDGGNRVLAIHRYVGLDPEDGTYVKEFYAAINQALKKWSGSAWTTLALPPGLDNLSADKQGIFRQLRDRTYYSNYADPVLMIKKEDSQVYEAGIPTPDAEKEIFDCESLEVTSVQVEGAGYSLNAGEWTIYTDGLTRNIQYYLDPGFDKHTKGDYGITLVQHQSGKTLKAIHRLSSTLNLDWFFGPTSGTCDAGATGNTLYDGGANFTERDVGQEVVKDDGTRGIVTELVNSKTLRTTLTWSNGDGYEIGGPSSENDYIAFEIFRWNKIDIDEVVVEFSSVAPDNNGDFSKGFRAVVYSDTGFEHFHLKQRTMLAEWANNPHGNRIFYCKFRKRWFVPINDSVADEWDSIKYFKVHVMQNAQASGPARITVDNIRLLKTPPLAAELKVQVATCDATEVWTNAANDYARATEGISCKVIANGVTSSYDFDGAVKDLENYGDGTSIDGSDMFIFDICGTGAEITANVYIAITLVDTNWKTAVGNFISAMNFRSPQERSLHVQEFLEQSGFDWSSVNYMTITNYGFPYCYIDNIRIQPPTASKVINSFLAIDMRIAEGIGEFVDHLFGQNKVVDSITDWLFHAWASFRVQGTGQGEFEYPNQEFGRYKFGDYSSACLAIGAQPGGAYSVTFIQNTDLTEYNEFNFNLDAFFHPKEYSDTYFMGLNWVEIPASDNDVMSIWMSSPDWAGVNKITFRLYTNQRASWSNTITTSTHTNAGGFDGGKVLQSANTSIDFRGKLGKRVRNETTGEWGIIGWAPILASQKHRCSTWGVTWNHGDTFSVDGWNFGEAGQRPVPDTDDYYEYVFDIKSANAKVSGLFDKSLQKRLGKYPVENQEIIENLRTILKDDGFEFIYKEDEKTGGRKGWQSVVINWKRGDMVHHTKTDSPWASWQSIAAHQIIVEATTKKAAQVTFQDWIIKKKGAVRGEVSYKVRLEDDQGYLGPISSQSTNVSVKGNDVQVSDIYVPYDKRLHRKRLYRTDVNGNFRYLDTIDRDDRDYLDTVPEDLLGEPIEEETFRPPKAKIMEIVQNRMAYADIIDRDGRYRPSRVQLSLPFRPHQCSDDDVFDVVPENGQRITGFKYYNGIYYCWKEKSFWTVDPGSYKYIDRDKTKGNIEESNQLLMAKKNRSI